MDISIIIGLVVAVLVVAIAVGILVAKRGKSGSGKTRDEGIKATGIDKSAREVIGAAGTKTGQGSTGQTDPEFLISLDLGSELTTKVARQLEEDKTLTLNDALIGLLGQDSGADSAGRANEGDSDGTQRGAGSADSADGANEGVGATGSAAGRQGNEQDSVEQGSAPGDALQTIIFVGVNGVGKTTTLGKIAHLLASQGNDVVLAAADTFRAGAADQLEVWGQRAEKGASAAKGAGKANKAGKVSVVRAEVSAGGKFADPASVAFKATSKALDEGANFLLIDTAGRQQTNANLMEELGKIKRVVEKQTTVQNVYLVVDGTAGQTSLQQAKKFHEVTNITGTVVTKLDGSTKGGAVFLVTNELGVPVKYIGTGEGLTDIEEFEAAQFVDDLLQTR